MRQVVKGYPNWVVGVWVLLTGSSALAQDTWPMAGANPERTSRNDVEIAEQLRPQWVRKFEPYISQHVQIIASDGVVLVSTAAGLYALDAETGAERWVYPTRLPLGHSPTVDSGVAYVGGLDRQLHAVDMVTGTRKWTFIAGAGFSTNPVVVDDRIYVGCRDGYFYAIHTSGELVWKYQTGGPITYSAAYSDGVLYFASNDGFAYALDAEDGDEVWKSEKLGGDGFFSYWPVIYHDRVIFAGGHGYRSAANPGAESLRSKMESEELYPANVQREDPMGPEGTADGPWADGSTTIDMSGVIDYFEEKPYRKTVHVLDRESGEEREIAPVLWAYTQSGTRFPPVVGYDDVLYMQNNCYGDPSIAGGHIRGWVPGSEHISRVTEDWGAVDEPHGASAGGKYLYWGLCCDRQMGTIDLSVPFDGQSQSLNQREWYHINYNLHSLVPDYSAYFPPPSAGGQGYKPHKSFGQHGINGYHGDVNPPIPYAGKLYSHHGNAVMAFAPGDPSLTEVAGTTAVATEDAPWIGSDALRALLAEQLQRMLDAGHLRTGYQSHGIFDLRAYTSCGDLMADYFQSSAETVYVLLAALPYLPEEMKADVEAYIQSEYQAYPPYEYNRIGWKDGAAREAFDLPDDVQAQLVDYPPDRNALDSFETWRLNPFTFYALWKYAEHFGDAEGIFAASKDRFEPVPDDAVLLQFPHILNAFVAGHIGYLNLEALAGQPISESIAEERDRLLKLRADNFSYESPYLENEDLMYCRTLNVSGNFIYLVPELAQYLRDHAFDKVNEALTQARALAPQWFSSHAMEGFAENAVSSFYDYYAPFLAQVWIAKPPAREIDSYVDVPGFATGDLFYIHKLALTLDAWANSPDGEPPPPGAGTGTEDEKKDSGGCLCSMGAKPSSLPWSTGSVLALLGLFWRCVRRRRLSSPLD